MVLPIYSTHQIDYLRYYILTNFLKWYQKTLWIQDIVKRLDPEYKILERWITTATEPKKKIQSGATPKSESEPTSTEFEKGITILFSLCGLNSEHLGSIYEKATQKNRREVASSRVDFPIDVVGWSSSEASQLVYLSQCILAGKGGKINEKINDISTAASEVSSMLSTYRSKPIIRPVIITNMKRGAQI
jgi:hypothetical protein